MGKKDQQQREALGIGPSRGDAAPTDSPPSVAPRPRLGSPHDSWPTVLKDVVREAPKTLLVFGGLLLTLLSLITHSVEALVGIGVTSSLVDPTTEYVVRLALEAARHAVKSG